MKLKSIKHIILITILGIISSSCVETFNFESEVKTFESVLVVEATITNELKQQEVLLSRTFQLGTVAPSPERNAQVKIIDNTNTEYLFKETDSAGIYISTIPFAVNYDRDYTLLITTKNGNSYKSSPKVLTQSAKMDSLFAVRDFNEDGQEGISIYINSFDPSGNSKYYRFEYEETYKIIAPFWAEQDLVVIDTLTDEAFGVPYNLTFVNRSRDEQVCYNTVVSNEINVINTIDLNEDRLSKYRLRFISRENYIISHRYSILVKQYVQSRKAFVYYKTLKLFSESESLFSENQSGFFEGNIASVNKSKEKVIGFFDVSSVDIKRIYFNYEDFFPNEQLPPYANGCFFDAPPLFNPFSSGVRLPLSSAIESGNFKYFDEHVPLSELEGPALLVTRSCGDCTVLGKSEAPEFWVE
jgi:Domain of unknown function (DUF4249)